MLENGELYDRWGFYNAFFCFVLVGGFSCGCQWISVLVYHNFYLFYIYRTEIILRTLCTLFYLGLCYPSMIMCSHMLVNYC